MEEQSGEFSKQGKFSFWMLVNPKFTFLSLRIDLLYEKYFKFPNSKKLSMWKVLFGSATKSLSYCKNKCIVIQGQPASIIISKKYFLLHISNKGIVSLVRDGGSAALL